MVRKALGCADPDAPDFEDVRGEELGEYVTRLTEQLRTLPPGPHRSQVEDELAKAKAKLAEPKVSGALRPLV